MTISPITLLKQTNFARFSRLWREFVWIASGQGLSVLGALIGVRLLTSVLPPAAYGELALGMTVAMIVNQVALGPLSNASLRFFSPSREVGEFYAYLFALRRLLTNSAIMMTSGALLVCSILLISGHNKWLWLGIASFGFALISGFNSVLDGMQNAARQRAVVAWHHAIGSWLRFLTAAGLVLWLGISSAIAMLGYVLASVIVLFSQLWLFKKRILKGVVCESDSLQNNKRWYESMLNYAMPFALWGTFTWAYMASSRWSLQWFCTTLDVGLYAVLYQLGYAPITLLTGVMVQLVSPVFFQRAGDATGENRMRQVYFWNWRLTMGALVVAFLTALLALIFHNWVFRLLVAPEYRGVSWLLPGMVLSGGLFAVGQFATISLLSGINSRILFTPKLVTALLGILLNFIFAAWYGVIGVVVANLLFSTVYLIWILLLVSFNSNQTAV